MSKHLFGLIATQYGLAANNRGENEGNITTLQKLLWKGDVHTTVSAEAIRWALRAIIGKKRETPSTVNGMRKYTIMNGVTRAGDRGQADENVRGQPTFIDDDVMGFMLAEAANTEGSDVLDELKKEKKAIDDEFKPLSADEKKSDRGKSLRGHSKEIGDRIKVMSEGTCDKRRGALEVTRALSLSAFAGDITFNAKSGKKSNTSLYGTEVHATRYQYGIAALPRSRSATNHECSR